MRHWATATRIGSGTRNAQGSRMVVALVRVIEICRQRGLSPCIYIVEVLVARRLGHPPQVLPVAVSA